MDFIFILIAVLIIVSNISKKKKQAQQAEERRRAQQQQATAQGGQPQSFDMPYTSLPPTTEGRVDPRFPDYSPAQQDDPRFPNYTPAPQPAAPMGSPQQRPAAPLQPRAQQQVQPRAQQQVQPRVQQQAQPRVQQQAQPRVQRTLQEGEGTTLEHAATSVYSHDTTVRSHGTTLQEIMGRRHTLEASSITGHSHTEYGMSGQPEACPPVSAAVNTPQIAAIKVGPAALMGDHNALAQAVIFSEILGKPKALRR